MSLKRNIYSYQLTCGRIKEKDQFVRALIKIQDDIKDGKIGTLKHTKGIGECFVCDYREPPCIYNLKFGRTKYQRDHLLVHGVRDHNLLPPKSFIKEVLSTDTFSYDAILNTLDHIYEDAGVLESVRSSSEALLDDILQVASEYLTSKGYDVAAKVLEKSSPLYSEVEDRSKPEPKIKKGKKRDKILFPFADQEEDEDEDCDDD